ncbi:MAG: GWxTD domain-containing protein [Ignavibacteria bacterium]|nr:GWxTD domain-containing protein [Ignavibacteria bacterium]
MRYLAAILLSLFIIQNSYSLSADKFFFDCSVSVFRGSEGKDIVELYYSVYQKFLKYSFNGNSGYNADAKLDVKIFRKNDNSLVVSNSYKIPSVVSDTIPEIIKNKIVGQINYEMKHGEYRFQVIASDFNNPGASDSSEFEVVVEDFGTGVKMSDIEFATSIKKSSDTKSIFYKNTLEVTPNAGGLYGKNISELHYYAELYNLTSANASDEMLIRRRILTSNNEELMVSDKKIKRGADSRVEMGMFKIDTMKTGSYIFELSLLDSLKNVSITKTKKFFLYTFSDERQSSDKGQQDYLKSEFAVLSEKELDDIFAKTIYIRTNDETKTYNSLKTLEEKRKYLFDFWKKKDTNPLTPQNEFKITFFKRINEANNKYKESFKEGWKTDRGRIFVVYGAPNEIEHHAFESDTKSYEVWIYDSMEGQGSTNAVFIEKETGTGVYTLVSSTIRGEFKDDDWQKQLKQFR